MENMAITTCDMHTAGEPLRIVESGYPEIRGNTMLERLKYAKSNFDRFRQLLMNEPRGHYDMYGAILVKPYPQKEADLGVLFIHNEGYSTMCGHGVIALGRYAVDKNLVVPKEPETLVRIDCPCGVVHTYVEYKNKKSGCVRFHSVPAFLYRQDVDIEVKGFGSIKVDVSYGGAFYALVTDKTLGLDVKLSPLPEVLRAASAVTGAAKTQIPLYHPEDENLAFLYGTIITDDNGHISGRSSVNICVFADAQVHCSPMSEQSSPMSEESIRSTKYLQGVFLLTALFLPPFFASTVTKYLFSIPPMTFSTTLTLLGITAAICAVVRWWDDIRKYCQKNVRSTSQNMNKGVQAVEIPEDSVINLPQNPRRGRRKYQE